jgi:hypothetical protein
MKEMPADRDISSGRVLRAFTWNGEAFKPNRYLWADEVVAIPIGNRRVLVERGFLEITPKGPVQPMKARVVDRTLPPWNWKATARETDDMRTRIRKTLAALIAHDARAAYEECERALGEISRCPQQDQHDLYAKWWARFALREARYGNLEPLRRTVRRRIISGAEGWIKEPPRQRGQPRPQRERDERNARLLLAIKYVNRLRDHFPAGRWPRAMVVEIVACHYRFSGAEVERAMHRGAKEIENSLRHLIG